MLRVLLSSVGPLPVAQALNHGQSRHGEQRHVVSAAVIVAPFSLGGAHRIGKWAAARHNHDARARDLRAQRIQPSMEMGGPSGIMTEFGPGDPGYKGGRWWVDANGNGEMDEDDVYFLCPLIPPGREEP